MLAPNRLAASGSAAGAVVVLAWAEECVMEADARRKSLFRSLCLNSPMAIHGATMLLCIRIDCWQWAAASRTSMALLQVATHLLFPSFELQTNTRDQGLLHWGEYSNEKNDQSHARATDWYMTRSMSYASPAWAIVLRLFSNLITTCCCQFHPSSKESSFNILCLGCPFAH